MVTATRLEVMGALPAATGTAPERSPLARTRSGRPHSCRMRPARSTGARSEIPVLSRSGGGCTAAAGSANTWRTGRSCEKGARASLARTSCLWTLLVCARGRLHGGVGKERDGLRLTPRNATSRGVSSCRRPSRPHGGKGRTVGRCHDSHTLCLWCVHCDCSVRICFV